LKTTMLSSSMEDMRNELKKLYMKRTEIMKAVDDLSSQIRKTQY